jgi:hypothetical protein
MSAIVNTIVSPSSLTNQSKAFTGPFSGNVNFHFTKISKLVTITVEQQYTGGSPGSTAAFSFAAGTVPAAYVHNFGNQIRTVIGIVNNNAVTTGIAIFASDGSVSITNNAGGGFTSGQPGGFYGFSISYVVP